MLNTDQFAAANKANFEIMMNLTAQAFDSVEQLTDLNLRAVKASLDEATEAGRTAFSAKDPQSLLQFQAGLLQPSAEKAAAYGKQVYGIVSGFAAGFEKVAGAQAAEAQRSFVALVEAAGNNAPEGTPSGVAFFKSAIDNANKAFDSLQSAGRQAAKTAEANFAAAAGTVSKASKAKRA